MLPDTLSAIKQDIRKFGKLYDELTTHWNDQLDHGNAATYPETITIKVIIHNMGFDSIKAQGYNHENEVNKLYANFEMLRSINEYHNKVYMTHYAFNEADCIITGHIMSEDIKW